MIIYTEVNILANTIKIIYKILMWNQTNNEKAIKAKLEINLKLVQPHKNLINSFAT